ncbi:hypothetical protein K502DRAFT_333369 [Neoconidiobolus thromboides FSU 785]|nr:hypothetical protein K502DRAFT_333369 [Neoconidiobolus thromboides FSU 785]
MDPNELSPPVILSQVMVLPSRDSLQELECRFHITEDKVDQILSHDLNNLYFNTTTFIQANRRIDNLLRPAYFEIELLKFNIEGFKLEIGLATESHQNLNAPNIFISYSHSNIILNNQPHSPLSITSVQGDTIGVLFTPFPTTEVSFTLNGAIISTQQFQFNQQSLYPTIIASNETFVHFNFGEEIFKNSMANFNNFAITSPTVIVEPPPAYV